MLAADRHTLAPDTRIGPYIVHECAGEGGMAHVYKVWHDGLHRFEALKTPRGTSGGAPDSAYVTRLLAEARVAAGLHHPNIVGIHNVSDATAELPFFTMDWVEGRDLAKVLAQRGAFSLHETIEILEPVAAALDYAHEHGVVHRDVKPANILLGEVRGAIVPRVVDFGISRAAEDEEGATKLTKSGMLVGTPEYMSPEQSGSGALVDFRTDLYSLGVVAFEMLCGRPPFTAGQGVSRLSILVAHVRDVAPLWEQVPHFPRQSGAVLMRALSKSPDERFANCRDFVAQLKAASQLDGPFIAFATDENGARTPFDASRFEPLDAATLVEKPAASAPIHPATRSQAAPNATKAESPTDSFQSLGARLSAIQAAQTQNQLAAPPIQSPPTPIPATQFAPPERTAPTPLPVVSDTPATRLGLGTSETGAPPKPRAALFALLGLAFVLACGGVGWTLYQRTTRAISAATATLSARKIEEAPLVQVEKAPDTVPVPRVTRRIVSKTQLIYIPFERKSVPSNAHPFGFRKVIQAGVEGQKTRKWDVTYQGNKIVDRDADTPILVRAPKEEITIVGTQKSAPARSRPRAPRRVEVERPRLAPRRPRAVQVRRPPAKPRPHNYRREAPLPP